MKVMMVQMPHFFNGNKRAPIYYPLGIGYLASVLKGRCDLVPMDLWIDNSDVDQAMRMIAKNIPDIFCISVYSTQYPYFKELASAIRKTYPGRKIIAGGPGATFSYQVLLEKTPVDICVIGEGEVTLKELLDKIDRPEEVKGLAFRRNGSVFLTAARDQVKDLDDLPLPDRDLFDMERYVANYRMENGQFKGRNVANIIAGRGCPYNCTFCSKTFHGIRLRAVRKISEEIGLLKDTYGINAIDFNDELVVINKKRTLELCSSLKKAKMKWGCQGRINLADEESLRAMKDAGCLYIGYGVESVTQRILDNMKKQVKSEEIIPTIRMTRAIGLEPIIQYMYGFPGENEDSIENTYRFFTEIDHPYAAFTTTPIPGTEIYNNLRDKALIGDEEEYLMKLTSGYNLSRPLFNMTTFTDEQLVIKKAELEKRVNRAYYRKHPIVFLKLLSLIIRNQVRDPKMFLKKLKSKVLK